MSDGTQICRSWRSFYPCLNGGWDHTAISVKNCRAAVKKLISLSALLQDLKQRDLLKDTLIVWSGEFGRTPSAQGGDGRDTTIKAIPAGCWRRC